MGDSMRLAPAVIMAVLMLGWAIWAETGIGFAAEVKAPASQNFMGVLTRINHKEAVIDNVAFRLKTTADLDFNLLVPETYVSFDLNADGMIVGLTAIEPLEQTGKKRFFAPTITPETTPTTLQAETPSAPTDTDSPKTSPMMKRQDGVWTN